MNVLQNTEMLVPGCRQQISYEKKEQMMMILMMMSSNSLKQNNRELAVELSINKVCKYSWKVKAIFKHFPLKAIFKNFSLNMRLGICFDLD